MNPRRPRVEEPAYLAFVRSLPCLICQRPGSDPAHLRTAARQYGKRQTGMGEKPDDKWVLPLCRQHHDEQHSRNELAWWTSYGIPDPFAVAMALYASWPGTNREKRERRKIFKARVRKPKSERKPIPAGKPLESRSNWPTGRKIVASRPLRRKI